MGDYAFWVEKCWCNLKRVRNLIFDDMVGKSMEVCINDVVVKADSYKEHAETQFKNESFEMCI